MNAILTDVRHSTVQPLRLRALLSCWFHRIRSRARLAELDDRLLADVGLTRSDVAAETRKPFWVA